MDPAAALNPRLSGPLCNMATSQSLFLGELPNPTYSPASAVHCVCYSIPLVCFFAEASGVTGRHHASAGLSIPSYTVSQGSERKCCLLFPSSLLRSLPFSPHACQCSLQILRRATSLLFLILIYASIWTMELGEAISLLFTTPPSPQMLNE